MDYIPFFPPLHGQTTLSCPHGLGPGTIPTQRLESRYVQTQPMRKITGLPQIWILTLCLQNSTSPIFCIQTYTAESMQHIKGKRTTKHDISMISSQYWVDVFLAAFIGKCFSLKHYLPSQAETVFSICGCHVWSKPNFVTIHSSVHL